MKQNDKVEIFGIQISATPIFIALAVVFALFIYTVQSNKNNEAESMQKPPKEVEEKVDKTLKDIKEKADYSDGISKEDEEVSKEDSDNNTSSRKEDEEKQSLYKISQPFANPYAELDKLVGLNSVKQEVSSMVNYIKVQEARKKKGLATKDVAYHMVFTGNPGTGKTTVARIMASIFKDLGVLKSGHTVETDRSGLVGEYVGQTGPKTNKTIDAAIGGVLFIDEAYTLVQQGNDYGNEAIAALLKRMEDDRDNLVVIIAGYTNEMNALIASNPGLKSRFNRYINFADYSSSDLQQIFLSYAKSSGYTLDASAQKVLAERMSRAVSTKNRHFGNGRYARNVFERVIIVQADRLAQEGGADNVSDDALVTIKGADLQKAFDSVKN